SEERRVGKEGKIAHNATTAFEPCTVPANAANKEADFDSIKFPSCPCPPTKSCPTPGVSGHAASATFFLPRHQNPTCLTRTPWPSATGFSSITWPGSARPQAALRSAATTSWCHSFFFFKQKTAYEI